MIRQWATVCLVITLLLTWWVRAMTLIGLGVVGLALNVYLLGNVMCFDCHPTLAILNHVAHWLTLGGVFALLASFVLRGGWPLHTWLLPATVAFLLWYGTAFLPQPPHEARGHEVTVATYNVLGTTANWHNTYQLIADNPVDVLVLQEVQPAINLKIYNQLQDVYPYQALDRDFGRNGNGVGVYSRYPIVTVERGVFFEPQPQIKARPDYLRVELDIDGERIVVYGYHAGVPRILGPATYDDWLTTYQTQLMLERVSQETLPTLVLCDCNTTPRTRLYMAWDAQFDDAFTAVGVGFGDTFYGSTNSPLPFGVVRLDYVWHSDDFRPLSARVRVGVDASDHAMLIVRLDFRPQ